MNGPINLLFGLLGSAGGTPWVPPAPEPLPAPVDYAHRPEPYDRFIAKLRPTLEVAKVFRVGPNRTYSTISAAVSAATRFQQAFPDVPWCDVVIDPGDYRAGESPCHSIQNIGFYSSSGEPNSVIWHAGLDYARLSFYLEGIFLDARQASGPKYSIHAGGGATAVLVGSTLTYSASGIYPVGTDGASGGYFGFYDCDLIGRDDTAFTNQHQSLDAATAPFVQVFVKTRFPGGMFRFHGMNWGQADELWVIDSSGRAATLVGTDNPDAVFAVSGSVFSGSGVAPVKEAVDRRDWPLPQWKVGA